MNIALDSAATGFFMPHPYTRVWPFRATACGSHTLQREITTKIIVNNNYQQAEPMDSVVPKLLKQRGVNEATFVPLACFNLMGNRWGCAS
jgi:NifU-like protein involved in Fe-S cluster formation